MRDIAWRACAAAFLVLVACPPAPPARGPRRTRHRAGEGADRQHVQARGRRLGDAAGAGPGDPRPRPVAGLSAVRCNAQDICQMTTGMGHANAAASVTALIFSGASISPRTYFLVAGIADRSQIGTIGSAAWARYLVDLRHRPRGRRAGNAARLALRLFGIDTRNPTPSRTWPIERRYSSSTRIWCNGRSSSRAARR